MAATRATIEMRPYASGERSRRMASSTISSVPVAINMISGRKRMYSTPLGARLTGMRYLLDRPGGLSHGEGLHTELHVHLGLVQNPRGGLADRRQERLRIHAHPNHHGDQRSHGHPFARFQIQYVMPHLVGCFAEEHALVEPQHVAGRQNRADGSENDPAEIGLRRTLPHQKLSYEIAQL